jgi:hypothetical protein
MVVADEVRKMENKTRQMRNFRFMFVDSRDEIEQIGAFSHPKAAEGEVVLVFTLGD